MERNKPQWPGATPLTRYLHIVLIIKLGEVRAGEWYLRNYFMFDISSTIGILLVKWKD